MKNDRPPRKNVKRGQFVIDPNTFEPVYISPKGERIVLRVPEEEKSRCRQ